MPGECKHLTENERALAARLLLRILDNSGDVRFCTNCEHFATDRQLCTLYNKQPPPRIVVGGCDAWQFDIPF